MSLLEDLLSHFGSEMGPNINLLLDVLHYRMVDEATKARFCRHVKERGGPKFWDTLSMAAVGKNAEEKFESVAQYLEKSAPHGITLRPPA